MPQNTTSWAILAFWVGVSTSLALEKDENGWYAYPAEPPDEIVLVSFESEQSPIDKSVSPTEEPFLDFQVPVLDSDGPDSLRAVPEDDEKFRLLNRIQLDLIGNYQFSRYNFTDLKIPYDELDGFTVVKLGYWLDRGKSIGPFFESIPVVTTAHEFFFQRYVQYGLGVQWYPIPEPKDGRGLLKYLRAIRLFGMTVNRDNYDDRGIDLTGEDVQIGLDYYYDNLFDDSKISYFLFTNATHRETNFSFEDYEALVWFGNIKVGPKIKLKGKLQNAILIPYAVMDWTYVSRYPERFFENFLRVGGGVRLYPKTDEAGGLMYSFIRRFHVFAEVIRNIKWLGVDAPEVIHETDFRFGLNFSTGGFFRE